MADAGSASKELTRPTQKLEVGVAESTQKLEVCVSRAKGLKHMKKGDAPYCICEVLHSGEHATRTTHQTNVKKSSTAADSPEWQETFELDPWHVGEPLEFTILAKGLTGYKMEGKATLRSEQFYANGFEGSLEIIGDGKDASPHGSLQVSVHNGGLSIVEPRKLDVSILGAHGLHHMNNFCGDSPYVVCEVKHKEKREKASTCQTKALKKTLEPEWNEDFKLELWHIGEALEFTIYDKGMVGSKVEGKVLLESERFYPDGFDGELELTGQHRGASLHVRVNAQHDGRRPVKPSHIAGAAKRLRSQRTLGDLRLRLPPGPRICILGGQSFKNPESEKLVQSLASAFSSLSSRVVVVTGGMKGVQETFAKGLARDFCSVVHLLPAGESSGFAVGRDVAAGATLEERMELFGQLGHLYIVVEGGPGVAKEARAAFARGAIVLPLSSTGGASSGQFDFPKRALEKPDFATQEQWAQLKQKNSPAATASTVVQLLEGLLDKEELGEPHTSSASHLRQRMRADTRHALHKPLKGGTLPGASLEEIMAKLAKAPPPRSHASSPKGGKFAPDARQRASPESLDDLPIGVPPPAPEPWPEPTEHRRTYRVQEDNRQVAMLRESVRKARSQLHDLDRETTQLTQQLKKSRARLWVRQKDGNAAQSRLTRILEDQRRSELPEGSIERAKALAEKELRLVEELAEARQKAAMQSQTAKRQDAMLSEERERQRGGEAHKIMERHPAGEIFLPPAQDSDSEDELDRPSAGRLYGARGGARGGPGGREQVDLDSEDDDSEGSLSPKGGSGAEAPSSALSGSGSRRSPKDAEEAPPPPPPAQRWRGARGDEEEEEDYSEASSVPSPSGSNSAPPSPAGNAAPPGPPAGRPAGRPASPPSSDEDAGAGSRPGASRAPALGIGGAARSNGAEEISSCEEDIEEEKEEDASSRSV